MERLEPGTWDENSFQVRIFFVQRQPSILENERMSLENQWLENVFPIEIGPFLNRGVSFGSVYFPY